MAASSPELQVGPCNLLSRDNIVRLNRLGFLP